VLSRRLGRKLTTCQHAVCAAPRRAARAHKDHIDRGAGHLQPAERCGARTLTWQCYAPALPSSNDLSIVDIRVSVAAAAFSRRAMGRKSSGLSSRSQSGRRNGMPWLSSTCGLSREPTSFFHSSHQGATAVSRRFRSKLPASKGSSCTLPLAGDSDVVAPLALRLEDGVLYSLYSLCDQHACTSLFWASDRELLERRLRVSSCGTCQ
jgi:hypothetical protein